MCVAAVLAVLLGSACLFAAVTLSARVLETEHQAQELAEATARVEQLALEVRRLEQEARALETDPDYIAAVARRKLGRNATGSPRQPTATESARIAVRPEPLLDPRLEGLRPWMQRIATDSLLRARLLTLAAALVLFGFTFLQERGKRFANS